MQALDNHHCHCWAGCAPLLLGPTWPRAACCPPSQVHLLPYHGLAAELVLCGDARVRAAVSPLLLAVGRELGLPQGL